MWPQIEFNLFNKEFAIFLCHFIKVKQMGQESFAQKSVFLLLFHPNPQG